MAQFRL